MYCKSLSLSFARIPIWSQMPININQLIQTTATSERTQANVRRTRIALRLPYLAGTSGLHLQGNEVALSLPVQDFLNKSRLELLNFLKHNRPAAAAATANRFAAAVK